MTKTGGFRLIEATLEEIRQAQVRREISARELVQAYLDRIEKLDRAGPAINSVININPRALEDADRLDASLASGRPVGAMHGVPVLVKDQVDALGMPTTLGSVLLKDFHPDRDAFVIERLRAAGAIILGKATLGELGGGDTHGTLFGSTKNPYALDRTAGGSSGGSGASISANFAAIALGQEGFASIRRPSAWNGIVGMRASGGVVSRSGAMAGWPAVAGQLGPMGRTVKDVATMLGVIAGYDPEDPMTALGVGRLPASFTSNLGLNGLKGARIGVIREPIGVRSEPGSDDYRQVEAVFERAVHDLARAGATVVDPLVIPDLALLLSMRRNGDRGGAQAAWDVFYGRNRKMPFPSLKALIETPGYQCMGSVRSELPEPSLEEVNGREQLNFNLMKAMADHRLDAIVHRTVEHQPTLIADGLTPPYKSSKGATFINTYLACVPCISVPAGFTTDDLPVGISFLGRPCDDETVIRYAYAYEQVTLHRRAPASTPALPGTA